MMNPNLTGIDLNSLLSLLTLRAHWWYSQYSCRFQVYTSSVRCRGTRIMDICYVSASRRNNGLVTVPETDWTNVPPFVVLRTHVTSMEAMVFHGGPLADMYTRVLPSVLSFCCGFKLRACSWLLHSHQRNEQISSTCIFDLFAILDRDATWLSWRLWRLKMLFSFFYYMLFMVLTTALSLI